LRLVARARAMGADGFRHPLRDLHLVWRHLLQQLLQERRAAGQGVAGGSREAVRRCWSGSHATLSIGLEKQEIRGPDGGVVKFEIDAHRKHCLLNGLDDIGLTMVKQDKIAGFESKAQAERPWV